MPGAVVVAVETPSLPGGDAALAAVDPVVASATPLLNPGTTVVIKSAVPVGTTWSVRESIKELRPDLDLAMAAHPRFVCHGVAIADSMHPDCIVVVTEGERVGAALQNVCQLLFDHGGVSPLTNLESKEVIKSESSAMLSVSCRSSTRWLTLPSKRVRPPKALLREGGWTVESRIDSTLSDPSTADRAFQLTRRHSCGSGRATGLPRDSSVLRSK